MIRAAVSISTVRFCVRRRKSSHLPNESLIEPKTEVFYQGFRAHIRSWPRGHMFPNCEPRVHLGQVFQSVRDDKADIGVMPVENTTAGTVSEVYDLLCRLRPVHQPLVHRKSRTVWRRCPAQSSRMSSVSARIRMRCRSSQLHFRARSGGGHQGGEHRHHDPERCRKRATKSLAAICS